MPTIATYTIEYDDNSVAWLVPIDNPSFRLALTQGTMLNVSLVHQDRSQFPPCGLCQRMLPLLDGLAICEACATGEGGQHGLAPWPAEPSPTRDHAKAGYALDTPVSIAELEARGLTFAKIPAGVQTIYVATLPRPGGTA